MPARELILRDMVQVRSGDLTPADVELIAGDYLLVEESASTGEFLPVEKHVSNIAYSLKR